MFGRRPIIMAEDPLGFRVASRALIMESFKVRGPTLFSGVFVGILRNSLLAAWFGSACSFGAISGPSESRSVLDHLLTYRLQIYVRTLNDFAFADMRECGDVAITCTRKHGARLNSLCVYISCSHNNLWING